MGISILTLCPEMGTEDFCVHFIEVNDWYSICLLYTSPSPRDLSTSLMPSSALKNTVVIACFVIVWVILCVFWRFWFLGVFCGGVFFFICGVGEVVVIGVFVFLFFG